MNGVVVNGHNSVVENDEVMYPCDEDDKKPDPKPDQDKDCCPKTYHIVLHFH